MKLNTSSRIGRIGCGCRWQAPGASSHVRRRLRNDVAHARSLRGHRGSPFRSVPLPRPARRERLVGSACFPSRCGGGGRHRRAGSRKRSPTHPRCRPVRGSFAQRVATLPSACTLRDRKSTRLNSSHVSISYAVFCLKKKNSSGTIMENEEHYTKRSRVV